MLSAYVVDLDLSPHRCEHGLDGPVKENVAHQPLAVPVSDTDKVDTLDESLECLALQQSGIVACLNSDKRVQALDPGFRGVNSLTCDQVRQVTENTVEQSNFDPSVKGADAGVPPAHKYFWITTQ